MSNTMGGTEPRRAADAYYTPDPLALAICRRLRAEIGPVGRIVEPSAGAGAFVRAARATWPDASIRAIEPNGGAAAASRLADAGADEVATMRWEDPRVLGAPVGPVHLPWTPGLILGNPPFLLAEEHIRIALRLLPEGGHLAFLLRASMLATRARVAGLWRELPPRYVWHVAPRPSFTQGGTDGAEYAVVVWRKGWSGAYEGGWLEWTPEKRRRAA